ncbi:MAG TPA: sulfite exporter TauE/SafE family protein [Clostridiales bacterium]|nr:sulfite exporter TauE/SafE family protein [Clostridiales bacterium]
MLRFLWFLLSGVLAGVLGGMGMGGGTALIPLASLFFSPNADALRTANLVSFIPMAIVAVTMHAKNGLIEKKGLFKVIFACAGSSFFGAVFSLGIDGEYLKKGFGAFLIALAFFQFFFSQKVYKDENDVGKSLKDDK